jgi:hypothetical protein
MQAAPRYTIERAVRTYCENNGETYYRMASAISPDLSNWRTAWDRVAFAILSAHVRFDSAYKALELCIAARDNPLTAEDNYHYAAAKGIRLQQIEWVRRLPSPYNADHSWIEFTRSGTATNSPEPWHDYRLRLQRSFRGLGIAKATFAACLMYPLQADLACVDVHIHRLFTGIQKAPHDMSLKYYLEIEDSVRAVGRDVGLPTFLTQWATWDWARGHIETHDIFPRY